MHTTSIALLGASGYSGIEATRILAGHPHLELKLLASDRWAGEAAKDRVGINSALRYLSPKEAEDKLQGIDAVLLATPAEGSLELVPKALKAGARVIDFSGAFRLKDASAYPTWYGFTHAHTGLLAEAIYGLPELNRAKIKTARLIANPGCYATAAALSLAPLREAKLVADDSIVINAASGVTGAGRKASEDYSFTEISDDFRAYRTFKHQHTPEIEQTLAAKITFTPHLLPMKRGILCTSFARLSSGAGAAQVASAFADAYRSEPFVQLAPGPDAVNLKTVAGTNRALIGFAVDSGRVVVTCAIDNLVKGAAGQAVQNLNAMFGWSETTGLDSLRGFHP